MLAALFLPTFALASCVNAQTGESASNNAQTAEAAAPYTVTEMGKFDQPWAIEFAPGTDMLFVTEKAGTMKIMNTQTGDVSPLSGIPKVDFGGQGGLGDIAFLPSETGTMIAGRTIFLSWVEAGEKNTRGAVVGRGTIACSDGADCAIRDLEVIWRQTPKVEGRGHYSHRIAISPDEQYLFIASGERQKGTPAQDRSNTLGTIVRLNMDGTPAEGNPFADEGGVTREIWSYGHRNILGMDWDAQGRLWEVEHGPAGGDELNLVEKAANYGWPVRSYGDDYNGDLIPDHTADDGFAKPAIYWTPVIAPGDMIIYSGDMFTPWKGQALITGLATQALIRVGLEDKNATELARYDFGNRLRSIEQGPDGAIWVAEDGKGGRILRLSM